MYLVPVLTNNAFLWVILPQSGVSEPIAADAVLEQYLLQPVLFVAMAAWHANE